MACLRSLYFETARELFVTEHEPLTNAHATLWFDALNKEVVVTNFGRTFVGNNLERKLMPDETFRLKNGNYVSFGSRFMETDPGVKCNPMTFVVYIADPWENPPECVTCSICQDVLNVPIALRCGHFFCRQCVTKWAQSQIARIERPSCPKCRAKYSFFSINKTNADLVKMINCIRDLQKTRE